MEEEEDHLNQTQLPALLVLLQLLQWQQPLQLSLSLHSLAHTHVLSLSHFALKNMPLL